MKKISLFILITISSLNAFSQIDKGVFLLSANGNYSKANTENGVTTNLNQTNGQYLNIGIFAEYFIMKNVVAGVGFDYNWNKEIRLNHLNFNNFYQAENMDLKSHILMPNIFLGYYYRILDKLYLNTNLKFGYGKYNSHYNTLYVGTSYGTDDELNDVNNGYVRGRESENKYDYFGAQISPELTYFFTKRFGINLGLGGIEYGIIDWKKDNSSWIVNFNPNYWVLGFKIKI